MKTSTWPQICAAARVQLAKAREPGDELAMLLASGILGMSRVLSEALGERPPREETLRPETMEIFAR
mgnify:CR=1 FL=1